MNRRAYYEDLRALAHEKRTAFNVVTARLGLREIRAIYAAEEIRIDYWPLPKKIKALYMCADGEYSVAIQRSLPIEPKLFALVHELKHHYRDQDALGSGIIHCGDYNQNELIEKGAEVFAAEFIYPEAEFMDDVRNHGITTWQADKVIHFKRNCGAKVSYRFLCKRLEWLRLTSPGQFANVKFQKLEYQLFGVPFYRRRRAS
jgi:Zn-dependent peptidase ImmA (M78 family)